MGRLACHPMSSREEIYRRRITNTWRGMCKRYSQLLSGCWPESHQTNLGRQM